MLIPATLRLLRYTRTLWIWEC